MLFDDALKKVKLREIITVRTFLIQKGSLTVETTHFSPLTSKNLKQAHFLGIVADESRQINTLTNS